LASDKPYMPFVFALASWLAFLARKGADGHPVPLNDPNATALQTALKDIETSEEIIRADALVCPDVLPAALTDGAFGSALRDMLHAIQLEGMSTVIKRQVAKAP